MDKNFKWYMISTVRGKEEQVLEALNNRIVAEKVAHCFDSEATEFGAFKIFKKPTITAKEMDKKRLGEAYKIKEVNIYPGYIFGRIDFTDEAWFVVRNTQFVTGIIGSSGKGAKPTPVEAREIRKMFQKEKEARDQFNSGKNLLHLQLNDIVEVVDGPYKGEKGPIVKLDINYNNATIIIESFGKKTEVELDLDNLKPTEEY
ncbi:transcription termination/antitermination protein NusG [Mycoplasma nasistruthionis]|uniref:Transcription termination/antitermination protein NusG n=1 Tax=Mycoplasma nasistruthionis TaxID=353852 RepID=A0A4Y6I615_9MOLU|nr:transcription termination/antitermination protein NusG [Mycoplasma nasistruthionis]QCZ36500.1 transcription termination/antitermination protein NusG [Mycoplasma nasistruthionis]QDF64792.1 transcription termination/antitermination protein NusG [Mycoplasma nasistruthionis]